MCYPEDMNPRDEVCEMTGDWAVVGWLEDGTRFPVGVFSTWCGARLAGNTWIKSMPKAERWEAERLYRPLTTEEQGDA